MNEHEQTPTMDECLQAYYPAMTRRDGSSGGTDRSNI